MRALFLTLYPETAAGPRYRVHQFLPYLRGQGVECVVRSAAPSVSPARSKWSAARFHVSEARRRLSQLRDARDFDVVFVQKALTTVCLRGLAGRLIRSAKRLVYDIDDAVHIAPPVSLRRPWRALTDPGQIAQLGCAADLVLAGNAWLADAMRGLGARRVEHFPTVVDTTRFTPSPMPPATFRVGWIGSPGTTPYLEAAAEALRQLDNAEILLIGAEARTNPVRSAILRPWSLETEVNEVQQFAAGIMPLPQTEWARGKCALKALQYMACGVPCVATPFGAVLDIIRHGENGLFADSTAEWRAALDQLRDAQRRRVLGEAARRTVVERFSLDRAAPGLLARLRSLA